MDKIPTTKVIYNIKQKRMEWEYRIVTSPLWYNIYRKNKLDDKRFNLEFLWANLKRIKDKDFAKVFYHKDDAVSALSVIKMRWWDVAPKEEETETKVEKQCWSEL